MFYLHLISVWIADDHGSGLWIVFPAYNTYIMGQEISSSLGTAALPKNRQSKLS